MDWLCSKNARCTVQNAGYGADSCFMQHLVLKPLVPPCCKQERQCTMHHCKRVGLRVVLLRWIFLWTRRGGKSRTKDVNASELPAPRIEVTDFETSLNARMKRRFENSKARPTRSASVQPESIGANFTRRLSNLERRRKTSVLEANGDKDWTNAVVHIDEALSAAPTSRKSSLRILLDEVGKNDVTAQELLQKLRHPAKKKTSLANWSPLMKNLRKYTTSEAPLPTCSEEMSQFADAYSDSESANSEFYEKTPAETRTYRRAADDQVPILEEVTSLNVATSQALVPPPAQSGTDISTDTTEETYEDSEHEYIEVPSDASAARKGNLVDGRGKDEVTQLLVNVAQGISKPGSTIDTLADILRHQNIQDNCSSLMDYALEKLRDQWSYILETIIPMEKIETMIFICLVQTITLQQVFKAVPVLACYASFWFMIYSTLNLYRSNYWMKEAEKWQRLLYIFVTPIESLSNQAGEARRGSISSSAPFSQWDRICRLPKWRIIQPYAKFFCALAIFVFSLSLANGAVPNAFPLCVISLALALLCTLSLNDQNRTSAYLCVLFMALALSPAVASKLFAPRTLPSMLDTSLFRASVSCIRIGASTTGLSILIIGSIQLFVAYQCRVKGTRLVEEAILPQMVILSWWRTTIELYLVIQDSIDWQDIAVTFAMLWLMVFPAGAAVGLVALFSFTQMKNATSFIGILKTAFAVFILFLPFIYGKMRHFLSSRLSLPFRFTAGTRGKAFAIYAILVFTSFIMLYNGSFNLTRKQVDLPWAKFENHCGERALEKLKLEDNGEKYLSVQMECIELAGAMVGWEGSVDSVEILAVDNFFANLLSYLPNGLAQRLRCFWSDQTTTENNSTSGCLTNFSTSIGLCSLSSNNVYTFKIDVINLSSSSTVHKAPPMVRLMASHGFKDIVTHLRRSDIVKFMASFDREVAIKYPTKMVLHRMECVNCQNKRGKRSHMVGLYEDYEGIWDDLYNACCSVFNFVFSPLFTAH